MYTPLEPREMPPLVRLGFEYNRGDVFEAYRHPDAEDSHIVINRTAVLRREESRRAVEQHGSSPVS